MIKYAEATGYTNIGEIGGMCTHVYEFLENKNKNPRVILVNAYEGETKVFKGWLYVEGKAFKCDALTTEERNSIESCTGKLNEVKFSEFIKGTFFDGNPIYECYKEIK